MKLLSKILWMVSNTLEPMNWDTNQQLGKNKVLIRQLDSIYGHMNYQLDPSLHQSIRLKLLATTVYCVFLLGGVPFLLPDFWLTCVLLVEIVVMLLHYWEHWGYFLFITLKIYIFAKYSFWFLFNLADDFNEVINYGKLLYTHDNLDKIKFGP